MSARYYRGPLKYTDTTLLTTGASYSIVNEAILVVKKDTGSATAVVLPAAGDVGRAVQVKDGKGDAATNNITVTVSGSGTIDGASSHVIASNYGKMWYLDNGTEWGLAGSADGTAGTSGASQPLVTDSSGNLAFTGRLTTTDGVSSGTARVVGGLAYTNAAASTAVASTSTETLFSTSYSIPANTLKVGSLVKIRFQGIATTTVGSDTLQIKLYLGGLSGTAVLTSSATDAVNSDVFAGEATLIVRTIGTSGTFVGSGSFTKVEAASGTATRVDAILASTAINTQAAQVVGVSATFNTANANSCRLDMLAVEIY